MCFFSLLSRSSSTGSELNASAVVVVVDVGWVAHVLPSFLVFISRCSDSFLNSLTLTHFFRILDFAFAFSFSPSFCNLLTPPHSPFLPFDITRSCVSLLIRRFPFTLHSFYTFGCTIHHTHHTFCHFYSRLSSSLPSSTHTLYSLRLLLLLLLLTFFFLTSFTTPFVQLINPTNKSLMDQRTTPTPASSSSSAAAAVSPRTHSRPAPRRTPSELSALSKSILSLHDDLSFSNDNNNTNHVHYDNNIDHATNSGSDHSGSRHRRSKRDREREREQREQQQELLDHHHHVAGGVGAQSSRETAPLLAASTRNSSYSFSSRSLDTGNYSDSFEGSSPLLYGDSFVDHQPLQRQFQDRLHQEQLQNTLSPTYGTDRPASQHTVHYDPPDSNNNNNNGSTPQRVRLSGFHPSSTSSRHSYRKSSPPDPISLQGPSVTSTRSHSFSSQAHLVNSRRPTGQGESSGSSPKLSDRSSDSDHHNRDMTEDTLIMPQIITGSEQDLPHIGTVDSDRGRPARNVLSSSPTVLEVMGPLPRMMTPSPVPLHARLSKIQREAKKGARVIDMETNGSSHHYDYEDVTDSSHDFSSRRHSVAEEDVSFSFFLPD